MAMPYRIVIQWSDEDQEYIAMVPAYPGLITGGDTPEEAARQAYMAAIGMGVVLMEKGELLPEVD